MAGQGNTAAYCAAAVGKQKRSRRLKAALLDTQSEAASDGCMDGVWLHIPPMSCPG